MKVCYVTMQFPAPSETFASNDVRELSRQGARISVHALLPEHEAAPRLKQERGLAGIITTHNSVIGSLAGLFRAVSQPQLVLGCLAWLLSSCWNKPVHFVRAFLVLPRAFSILDEIKRQHPDVVHLYWGHYPSVVGFLVQRAMPQVVTSISLVAYDLEMAFGGTPRVVRGAQLVRTLGEVNVPAVARFANVPESRVKVIYDGVDIKALHRIARGHRRVPGRVVSAGRLIASKGMDDVIRAFSQVAQDWPRAELRILGEGPELSRLQLLASELGVSERVSFLGHVSHERVVEEFAAAEVLLLLSTKSSERLPNVVKEGMACGSVCITTPTPGIEELVSHGKTGFIVPMHSPDDAVNAMRDVFAGRVPDQLAAQAQAHIVESFDLGQTAKEYLGAWREAVSLHRRRLAERYRTVEVTG